MIYIKVMHATSLFALEKNVLLALCYIYSIVKYVWGLNHLKMDLNPNLLNLKGQSS